MAQVTVSLPDSLAAEAQEAGLLDPARLERLLANELKRQKAFDDFFDTSARLQAAAKAEGLEPMSPEEIAEELHAMRAQKRVQALL